jgi:hypothetical protein
MRLRRQIVFIVLVGLLASVGLIPHRVIAQTSTPAPLMYLSNYIDRFGEVLVDFANLPPTTQELRWRWNELPADDEAWEELPVGNGFAFQYVSPPPDTGNPLCQHHTFYAELRKQDGSTFVLSSPFAIDRSVDVEVDLLWSSHAMVGYTNQDTVKLKVLDDQECTGIMAAGITSDMVVGYNIPLTDEYYTYRLPFNEGPITLYFEFVDRANNREFRQIEIIRDTTPPVLSAIAATIAPADQGHQLTITGQFTDTYAHLPWAIEWQFIDHTGSSIGDPVFHILHESEVLLPETVRLLTAATPFQITIGIEAIPAQAAGISFRLFDRAGNGQTSEPMMFTTPPTVHTVYVPLVGR